MRGSAPYSRYIITTSSSHHHHEGMKGTSFCQISGSSWRRLMTWHLPLSSSITSGASGKLSMGGRHWGSSLCEVVLACVPAMHAGGVARTHA